MTEFDAEGPESNSFPRPSQVNRDSATRRAGRLDVESDVGELCSDSRSVRSREAVPSAHFWQALPVLWLACAVHLPIDGNRCHWQAHPRLRFRRLSI